MNNKKKQTAVMAMATVLSVTSIASPLTVMAQEDTPAPPAIMQEENGQQKTAPDISLPENLQATAGTALEEITLPEHWSWEEKSTVITVETTEYPARFSVDDVTYDYSNVEGYNEKGHYVERMVTVTVEPAKSEPAEPVQGKSNRSLGNALTAVNAGDIEINETNFPDKEFRTWLEQQSYGQDRTITQTEIAGITEIIVIGNTDIEDLTGIEHFTALTTLYCTNTGISDLDVSKNTKLTDLYCYNNAKLAKLTVAGATELTNLNCSNTGITSLDVSKNTKLTDLYCYDNGKLANLTVAGATELTRLYCANTGITSLDVSQNAKLTGLRCYDNAKLAKLTVAGATELNGLDCSTTGITSLDVSQNAKLTTLWCNDNAKLAKLTVAGATELTILDCSNTGISDLDVSKNAKLTRLYCYDNAKLAKLTVAGATELTILDCSNDALAYLNIGTNSNLIIDKSNLKPVSLEITEDSFNMADKFIGIELGNVTNVSGADYKNGIMSNYDVGTPITYTYACGTSKNGAQTIDVTLNLTGSFITITDDMNKTYDGIAVNVSPTVKKSGSTGAVSYKWEHKKNDANWETIVSAPTDAGTYRVTATVASDNNSPEATSKPVEFTIAQAEPSYTVPQDLETTFGQTLADVTLPAGFSWTDDTLAVGNAGKNTFTAVFTPDDTKNYKTVADISVALTVKKADNALTDALSIEGWTYGDTPAVASAGFRFGKPRFLYSDKADGTYTETVPTNAGTWYVKAVVDGTDNYEGAESDAVSFVIAPNDVTADSQITVPDITADTNLDELVLKDGDVVLAQGADYDVAKTQDGNKVTVTITFKGNYTGTITRSYTVEEKIPAGGDKDNNKSDGTKTDNQNTNDKKAVQTGDTTSLGLWSSLLAFSAGIAVFLKRKKQRKETEE